MEGLKIGSNLLAGSTLVGGMVFMKLGQQIGWEQKSCYYYKQGVLPKSSKIIIWLATVHVDMHARTSKYTYTYMSTYIHRHTLW